MRDSAGMHSEQAVMDGEHRVQLALIVALERAIDMGAPPDEIRSLVSHLVEYTNVHFMSEQMLMRFTIYPDLRGHEAEHHALLGRVRGIVAGMDAGDSRLMITESQVVRQLLLEHNQTQDLMFAHYLAGGSGPMPPWRQ
jgi:hemerythrin